MNVFVSEYVGWVDQGNRMNYWGPYICPLCTMHVCVHMCVYMCVCFVFGVGTRGIRGIKGIW